MHWKGYSSRVGGVGGNAACDGAILLQCEQLALCGLDVIGDARPEDRGLSL